MTILWPHLIATLLPTSLPELLSKVPALARRFASYHRSCGPVQVQDHVIALGVKANDSAWLLPVAA